MDPSPKARYPVGMRGIIATLILIAVLSLIAFSSTEAALGARFADLYSAFVPLYSFYRSYADHLFSGAPVVVPSDSGRSCDGLLNAIDEIPSDLLPQTPSVVLAVLRVDVVEFCASYRSILEGFERSSPDEDLLERASEGGLFAAIHELNLLLDEALSQVLSSLDEGIERWRFAVAFAVRTIIDRDAIDRIDDDLRRIFYGEDRDSPPMDLPEGVSSAMAGLISLSGRSLSPDEVDRARHLAEYIEYYFVFDVLPNG